jgi:hypothetical protein
MYKIGAGYNGKHHGFLIDFGYAPINTKYQFTTWKEEQQAKRIQFGCHYSLKFLDKNKWLAFFLVGSVFGQERIYVEGPVESPFWDKAHFWSVQTTVECAYRFGAFEPGVGVDVDVMSNTRVYSETFTLFPYVGLKYNLDTKK